jgi:hypothetical protein
MSTRKYAYGYEKTLKKKKKKRRRRRRRRGEK